MISKSVFFLFFLFLAETLTAKTEDIYIRSIRIEGNKKTKDAVILREMLFKATDYVPSDSLQFLLKLSENRIQNLNLFNEVKILHTLEDSTIEILIRVIEKWYFWPIPTLEFSDRNFNVWSDLNFDPKRTNYGLYLFQYNLAGHNHTLKLALINGYNRKLGLEYSIPFLSPHTNWGLSGKSEYSSRNEVWHQTLSDQLVFFNKGEQNLIAKTIAELDFKYRFNDFNYLSLGTAYEIVQIDKTVQEAESIIPYLLNNASRQSSGTIYASVQKDQRDNIFLPMEGLFLKFGSAYSLFRAKNYTTGNLGLNINAQHFSRLSDRWYTAAALYAAYNSHQELPYHNYKMLGYDQSIRGFEPYVIDGHAGLLSNMAIRYHLLRKPHISLPFIPLESYNFLPLNIYLAYFIDAGYASNRRTLNINDLPNRMLFSNGISVQTLFYNDRVFRFEYSLNSLGESGLFIHFKKAI